MRPLHYTGSWINKHSRTNSPLQNLSAKRNWANCVMLAGIRGALHYLQRQWPTINIQRAIWALDDIETDIDIAWYKQRDKLKAKEMHELAQRNLNGHEQPIGSRAYNQIDYSPKPYYR